MSDSSDPMDCSLPGSSVHGIFQAKVLKWGAIAFSAFGPYFTSNHLKPSSGDLIDFGMCVEELLLIRIVKQLEKTEVIVKLVTFFPP